METYAVVGSIAIAMVAIVTFSTELAGIRGANRLYKGLLQRVLNAPLQYGLQSLYTLQY